MNKNDILKGEYMKNHRAKLKRLKKKKLIKRLRTDGTITEISFEKKNGEISEMVAIGVSHQPEEQLLLGRTRVLKKSHDGTYNQWRIVDNRSVKEVTKR